MEGERPNGGLVTRALHFDRQRCPGLAEIPQWKSERDRRIELRRQGRAAHPSHFTVAAEQFCAFRGHEGTPHDQADEMPPHRPVGIHAGDHFLTGIAALAQAEGLFFEIRFRRDNLFVQIRPRFRNTGFQAKRFAGMAALSIEMRYAEASRVQAP